MANKEAPRGSFKDSKGKWFVACWECYRGINGNAECTCGVQAKNLKVGCFAGKLLDKFLPDREEGDRGVR